METLFPRPTSHCDPNRSRTVTIPAQRNICQQLVWRWLATLQGYNLEIRHIPRKKNPADSLSRQLVADALVRKGSVKDANAEYVQKLRISETATDQEIQNALHQLFKSSPQGQISGQDNQGLQGQSILIAQLPLGEIQSMNDDSGPQGTN